MKELENIFKNLHLDPSGLVLTKLHGDASNRVYYRAALNEQKSFIVMQLPEGASSVSEEITNLKQKPTELPFLAVQRYLESLKIPVPKVFAKEDRLILLEDLGDETFEKKILTASSEYEIETWYRKAIDLLKQIQKSTQSSNQKCIAQERSFDATLLNWEFDHFFEYGITARTGEKISDLDVLRKEAHAITDKILGFQKVFVHRDYQSRNLMIRDGELVLLDFQDALMGPLPYDLVALLRDSYIALPSPLLLQLIAYFSGGDEVDFLKSFDLMTVQRKLKDAGRFVYIDRVKKNPSFLKHIPNSLAYVREAFERQPDTHAFYEVLKKYVPEWN